MENDARNIPASHPPVRRDATDDFMSQYEINDSDVYLTSDAGGPISDQNSLSAGERGPTLLEDFIFRQKECCQLFYSVCRALLTVSDNAF